MMANSEKFERLIKRYPEVFRGKSFNYDIFKKVYEQVDTSSNLMVFYYDKDIIHYVVMAMVIKYAKYLDIKLFSAYELIDIYLGNIEEYSCLSVIDNEVVAVYDGAGIPNKQKGNIIAQVMEQQRMSGRKFWMFYKGNESKLKTMYPEVYDIIDASNFKSVSIDASGPKDQQEAWEEEDII